MTEGRIRFNSEKEELKHLLEDIDRAEIQLPEFQRDWVWDDEHVLGILTSVSLSYPVGALMLLQTGNESVRLKARPITGVTHASATPDRLILDGQQRLTALYQALMADGPVKTFDIRDKEIERYYYFDMRACLDPAVDRENAIRSIAADRKVRNFRNEVIEDFSTPEKEYKGLLFPARSLFSADEWRRAFNEFWDHDREKTKFVDQFEKHVVEPFKSYWLPVIVLGKETPKEAICQVFEKVNTGGVSLTVFELLTAMFAVDDFDLRDAWSKTRDRLKSDQVVKRVENTDFLQAVCLLATNARRDDGAVVSCKRKDILRLEHSEYQEFAPLVEKGYKKVGQLLRTQFIFAERDLPYRTQLTPFAAVLGLIGTQANKEGVRQQLFQWYWCGVLGEMYGSAVETRFARDLTDLLDWIEGGPEPLTVTDAYFLPSRLLTLRSRTSAAYKGIAALLMRDGGQDFQSGETITNATYNEEAMDIHHIFPRQWCVAHGIPRTTYESIVNKTVISARTNRMIGGKAPSEYLSRMQREAKMKPERMDEILASHAIDPALLRADDFTGFFAARQAAILERIERAMGRPIALDREEAA